MKTRLGLGVLLCVAMLAGTVSADWVDTFDANINGWSTASGPATPAWSSAYTHDRGTEPTGGCLKIANSGTGGYVKTYVSSPEFDVATDIAGGAIRFQVDLAAQTVGGTATRLGLRLFWDDNNYYEMHYGPADGGTTGKVYFSGKVGGASVTDPMPTVANANWYRHNMQMWIQIDTDGKIQRYAKDLNTGTATHAKNYTDVFDIANLGNVELQLFSQEMSTDTDGHAVFDNVSVTGSSPVPEPATMSLLGLGGVLALIRRRR